MMYIAAFVNTKKLFCYEKVTQLIVLPSVSTVKLQDVMLKRSSITVLYC